jgi:F-type H+-transporting ATPase subunit b
MDVLTNLLTEFGVTWPKFLSQVILFGVVYLLLSKFAFGPVLSILEERRKRIEEGQLNAEKIKKQLAEAELRYQEILRQANDSASKLIEEARASSEASTQRQIQQAIREAEEILAKARDSIGLERAKMVAEVKAEMVNLVVDTTARVTGKILTPADQSRLTAETAKELAA